MNDLDPTEHNLNLNLLLSELEKSSILERPNILYSEWSTSTQRILKDYFDEFNKEVIYTCDFQSEGESIYLSLSLAIIYIHLNHTIVRTEKRLETQVTSMLTSLTRVIKSVHIVCIQNLMAISLARTIKELTV